MNPKVDPLDVLSPDRGHIGLVTQNTPKSKALQLDRFAETIATGKASSRRLSPAGLGRIYGHWPEAMRRVVEISTAHPEAQRHFLATWTRVGWQDVRQWVGDDDLFYAALRMLLPSYDGPDRQLFGGQLASEPVGLSWTRSHNIAVKFALYGIENVDPNNLIKARIAPRSAGVVLCAHVDSSAIICAPCLLGHKEGEYVVDPRRLKYSTDPIGRSVTEAA